MQNQVAAMSRLGTEDAFSILKRAQELALSGRKIINLGIGQPDFTPAPHIIEAAVKALRDDLHGYTAPNGIIELREAVASNIKLNHNVEINPDNIVIVPGGKLTMFFAITMFGEPGAEIIYPDPGFPIYRSLIDYSGATPVPVKAHEDLDFSFCIDEIESLLNQKTRLLIINNPNNPTGAVTPAAEIEKLVKILDNYPNVIILSDEIYDQLIYENTKNVSLLTFQHLHDRLIVLNGWSKTFAMTRWRLGYGIWPNSLIDSVLRLVINSYSCVNIAAQYAGLAALKRPKDGITQMLQEFDCRRKLIVPALNTVPGFTCKYPLGAFYAFPNITGTGLSSRNLQIKLLEEVGIATIAGSSFGSNGEGYLRISYANSITNIKSAMARISEYFEKPSF